jgi:hypothetical protein
MDGVQFSTKNNCAVIVRFWHEAADRGSATSRQILRVEQTCHGRRGPAESDPDSDIGPADRLQHVRDTR